MGLLVLRGNIPLHYESSQINRPIRFKPYNGSEKQITSTDPSEMHSMMLKMQLETSEP